MTATSSYQTATAALFQAHAQAANIYAVYWIGAGVWLAACLLAWGYADVFRQQLHLSPWLLSAALLGWLLAGGTLLLAQQRKLRQCQRLYDLHVRTSPVLPAGDRSPLPATPAATCSARNHTASWLDLPGWFQGSLPTRPQRRSAQLPVSLFGAHAAQPPHARTARSLRSR